MDALSSIDKQYPELIKEKRIIKQRFVMEIILTELKVSILRK
uniref:Uncharacterized protein n=1 Tax=Lepeophtheirus salmonis TaxID=72036 RepID=A0A0K2TCR6_LEPSM